MHPMLHAYFYDAMYSHPVECSSSDEVGSTKDITITCVVRCVDSSAFL
jgi:hypothetical protein